MSLCSLRVVAVSHRANDRRADEHERLVCRRALHLPGSPLHDLLISHGRWTRTFEAACPSTRQTRRVRRPRAWAVGELREPSQAISSPFKQSQAISAIGELREPRAIGRPAAESMALEHGDQRTRRQLETEVAAGMRRRRRVD